MTSLAFLAGTGAAFASCPAQTLSTPFAQYGDTNSYFMVPGGAFDGSAPWSLSNAAVTPGGNPLDPNGQSLTINGGGSATSPWFCVDSSMPSVRFFAHQITTGSDLQVQGIAQLPWGTYTYTVADLADGSMPSWAPVNPISVNTSSLPLGFTLPVEARLVVPGSGSWQVAGMFVDPYRAG